VDTSPKGGSKRSRLVELDVTPTKTGRTETKTRGNATSRTEVIEIDLCDSPDTTKFQDSKPSPEIPYLDMPSKPRKPHRPSTTATSPKKSTQRSSTSTSPARAKNRKHPNLAPWAEDGTDGFRPLLSTPEHPPDGILTAMLEGHLPAPPAGSNALRPAQNKVIKKTREKRREIVSPGLEAENKGRGRYAESVRFVP
jgi:hypothetical protein